jgi:excisionase family DNA binding protein
VVAKQLIDIKKLSQMTSFSVSTLYAWVNQRRIPFIKFGHRIRFDLQQIDSWIEENAVKEFHLKEM